jgi:hypothetical protein
MVFSKTGPVLTGIADMLFGTMRAEKKCAASPGGTFVILLRGLALSTHRPSA